MGLMIRSSSIHAAGCYTTSPLAKGVKVVEYTGPRISKKDADAKFQNSTITYLFGIGNGSTVINGYGTAMFINHSCDPNCESVIEGRRVFIEAIRNIAAGEELAYDYQIQRDTDDPADIDEIFACRCGSRTCRGTMLWPAKRAAREGRRRRAIRVDSAGNNRARSVSAGR